MKRIHLAIAAVVLPTQAVLPTVPSAQSQSAQLRRRQHQGHPERRNVRSLIGAAIRVHPSRRPTPGRPSRTPTISPQITRHAKAMNVVVRF
jgi:hypothetical protein